MSGSFHPTREQILTAKIFATHAIPDPADEVDHEHIQRRLLNLAWQQKDPPSLETREGLWLAAFTCDDDVMKEASEDELQVGLENAKKFWRQDEIETFNRSFDKFEAEDG